MPRAARVTLNSERRRRRSAVNNRNVSQTIESEQPIPLVDSVKCAYSMVPKNFESLSLGDMSLRCSHCQAKHFQFEITQRQSDSFSFCCHKGKVRLPDLSNNVFFQNLCSDFNSPNPILKKRSENYLNNIRSFNSAFAMVSSEAKLAETTLRGVYHFKIHDVFYHRAGSLCSSSVRSPRYAQLYFYDVDTAVRYRIGETYNSKCDESVMRSIAEELNRVNPFVNSFIAMGDYCRQPQHAASEVHMVIKVNRDLDIRRFNDAVQTDVAAIFTSSDGAPPFDRNMVVFSKNDNTVRNVSVLDSSLDPLAYPLLFPNGDLGWHTNISHSSDRGLAARNKVTVLQYAAYRLAIRDGFSILHSSQKLFLQWIVDMYVRIEGGRLQYIRQNQTSLRAELYNNLTDFLQQHPNDSLANVGRKIVLPSSFIGSPRNMHQNYLDAMCIVQHFGKPSLFITMTCNPRWSDITENLRPGESAHFRPDLVVRVFKGKLKKLIECIDSSMIFGKVEALIYTIEFQKRGLPHAHILITLESIDRITDIDKVVCAEIPDSSVHPKLHQLVRTHMVHGPCGVINPNSVCMSNGKCSKNFPKAFCQSTLDNVNGYPVYRRRDNGLTVDIRGNSIDNRFVVPYNSYLLAKFNCHINVEVCSTVKSVKYIYKYVYKGYDSAVVEIQTGSRSDDSSRLQVDEVQNFLSGRYVGSTEGMWRILEYPMHFQSHTIIRMECHLPHQQNVCFRDNNIEGALLRYSRTKLTAYFELNQVNESARRLLYTEIPLHFVWIDKDKKWQIRQRGGNRVIARMYNVSPKDIELFHLRLLLLHVRGARSFEELRTFNRVVYPTFVEAAYARGIASNCREWYDCLSEARETRCSKQIRELFGFICGINVPSNALDLWEEFKISMAEDFQIEHSEVESFNLALLEIEEILLTHNVSCEQLGLPKPVMQETNRLDSLGYDPVQANLVYEEMYQKANLEQKNVIDKVIQQVLHSNTGSNVYVLTAHAGCGKTFVQTAIINKLQSLDLVCIACAFSGIASTLLVGGRTLHNVFKLPIPILENSSSSLSVSSRQAQHIKSASLIIIDEVSMCPVSALKLINNFLNDLCHSPELLFGGKTLLLCGDFRQTLPVVPHGSRVDLIENCITSWTEYPKFHKLTLSQNMRAHPNEVIFVNFLKSLGDGDMQTFPLLGSDIIEIPPQLVGSNAIINDTFGDISQAIRSAEIVNSVILAPRFDDCCFINSEILCDIPGEERNYFSCDQISSDDYRDHNNYPVEFLNSINVSGLPPHKLVLKENCILLLIRNLNTSKALVNGTRMRLVRMHRNCIECEVLTGNSKNTRILIPRIKLTYSGTLLPFNFQRIQFPVILAFAMTINKSQGQTFSKVGILLRQPVFSHGQLYVAASRVRSFDNLRIYVHDTPEQGHLAKDDRVFTKNIVYREVLN